MQTNCLPEIWSAREGCCLAHRREHAENSTAERSTTRNRSSLGEARRDRREGKEVELCFQISPLLFDLAGPRASTFFAPSEAERPLHSRARRIPVAAALRAQMRNGSAGMLWFVQACLQSGLNPKRSCGQTAIRG